MFNNREISIGFWAAVFFLWCLTKPQIRESCVSFVKAALARKLILNFSLMAIYIVGVVIILELSGIWKVGNVKATIEWTIVAAPVMVYGAISEREKEGYFKKVIRDGLRLSVLLGFIANFYVFGLPIELCIVPITAVLSGMLAASELKEEFASVRSILDALFSMFGMMLLSYWIYMVFKDVRSFAQLETLRQLILPFLMSALFLPFLFILVVVVSYEELFMRLRQFMSDSKLRRFTKFQLLRRFGLNFRKVNRWSKIYIRNRPNTEDEVLSSINRAV